MCDFFTFFIPPLTLSCTIHEYFYEVCFNELVTLTLKVFLCRCLVDPVVLHLYEQSLLVLRLPV